jgi:ApaLI-like restriction endonuclease
MSVEETLRELAKTYALHLEQVTAKRVLEMQADDTSHYLIYRVLGIAEQEGQLIDVYQNKGRFLYKYAGSFLEAVTKLCFKEAFPEAASLRISNTKGQRLRTFEIDCLIGQEALEIKWKDATTDGDHITKEHTRLQVIADAGYTPVRVMFYAPQRTQAIRIQQTLKTLYQGIGGQYYFGDTAWEFVKTKTGINLKTILEDIAKQKAGQPL